MGGKRLSICGDVPADELRRLARRELDRAAAARMQAIAGALAGLHDRPRQGRPARLDDTQRAALLKLVLDGPDVEATGLSALSTAVAFQASVAE